MIPIWREHIFFQTGWLKPPTIDKDFPSNDANLPLDYTGYDILETPLIYRGFVSHFHDYGRKSTYMILFIGGSHTFGSETRSHIN